MDNVDHKPLAPAPSLAERVAAREVRRAERDLRDRQRAEDEATLAEHPRPRTRADCESGPRPCPWVGCRHHLYLDMNPETGSIKIGYPDREPWELEHTCSLDLADHDDGERSGMTLEAVSETLNVTKERVRQLESRGLKLLRHARRRLT